MKTNILDTRERAARSLQQANKYFLLAALFLIGMVSSLRAQVSETPAWWFGVAGGANFNFYRGSTQKLNNSLTVPTAFHDGNGTGLYLAPMVEYLRPGQRWGIMLQAAYDSRKGEFDQIMTPCNCPTDLSTKLSYVTVEPSFRFAPFKTGLYVYAGPRLAFNLDHSFKYQQKANPSYPLQTDGPEVKGDFSDVQSVLVSMQVGAGYDIPLNSTQHRTQFVVSPFVAFKPYFGQSPRTIESWNVTTLTVGAAFKFGVKRKSDIRTTTGTPAVDFTVNSPKNLPEAKSMRETFPLRNYIFFDKGSSEIPNRYVLLKKNEVKDFKAEQLEVSKPKKLSGRSKRQMVAYYNVLNILGDRMQKDPQSKITLVGSSEGNPEEGKLMSESVKQYLVEIFGIDAARIETKGASKPALPSVHEGATYELDLLREGDRRVTVESSSPALFAEFQSGPVATGTKSTSAPASSYVSFTSTDKNDEIASWTLDLTDEKGAVQHFGPYTEETVSIPGKTILGDRTEGDYKAKMTAQARNGETVVKETNVHVNLWTAPKDEEGTRYSVIFEFNESKVTAAYEKYLTEVVVPQIPENGVIIIHGYTDVIGDEARNQKLSEERAGDVKRVIEKGLLKAGKKNVKFDVSGSGENEDASPFENKYPEERFYNRTVVIDIVPVK